MIYQIYITAPSALSANGVAILIPGCHIGVIISECRCMEALRAIQRWRWRLPTGRRALSSSRSLRDLPKMDSDVTKGRSAP